jgi:hypothetical protein
MTFKAELSFKDSNNVYTVFECDYNFDQEIDITNKPSGKPKPGIVSVLFESKMDEDIVRWMFSPGNVRSGEINFYSDESKEKKLKTLIFNNALCIGLQDRFSSSGSLPMLTTIRFVAEKMTLDGVDYNANWTHF